MIETKEARQSAAEDDSVEEQNERLKTLTAELLRTNQELRFKLVTLEDEAESLKRAMNSGPHWAGMLF
jgi:predicted RNase H-like nuclease (RuvC/YqgF family)